MWVTRALNRGWYEPVTLYAVVKWYSVDSTHALAF